MMPPKTERNQEMLRLYFEEDWSTYKIAQKFGMTAPVAWKIIKRELGRKLGYQKAYEA